MAALKRIVSPANLLLAAGLFALNAGLNVPLFLPGETPYRVAILYFDSLEAIRTAFASEIGRACAEDRRKFAGDDDLVTMLLFDTEPL